MVRKSKIEPYDHLLGEMHDYEIAEMAGTLPAAVCKRRMSKGIDAYPIHVLKRYVELLGKQSDISISEMTNIPTETVGSFRRSLGIDHYSGPYRSKLAGFDHLLPTMSNAEIARLAGCSRESVRKRRKNLAKTDCG